MARFSMNTIVDPFSSNLQKLLIWLSEQKDTFNWHYSFPLLLDEKVMITNRFPIIPKKQLIMHQAPKALLQPSLPQSGS